MVFHQNFHNFFSATILWWNFIPSLSSLTDTQLKRMIFIVCLFFMYFFLSQNLLSKKNNLEHLVRMERSNIGAFSDLYNYLYIYSEGIFFIFQNRTFNKHIRGSFLPKLTSLRPCIKILTTSRREFPRSPSSLRTRSNWT